VAMTLVLRSDKRQRLSVRLHRKSQPVHVTPNSCRPAQVLEESVPEHTRGSATMPRSVA